MANQAYKYYQELPQWAKGVIVVGVLTVTYIFVNQVIKKIRQEADKKKAEQGIASAADELNKMKSSGTPMSYPKSIYDGMASQLVEQFSGCDPSGTYPVYVYSDLSKSGKLLYDSINKMNNERDFLELLDSFGVRTYDDCGLWGDIENATLYKAVSNELNTSEIKFINDLLKNRKITYQF